VHVVSKQLFLESPTQTTSDQEPCLTKSATIDFKLGNNPKPAVRSKSRASIPKPSKIASQATRRTVALILGLASVVLAGVTLGFCLSSSMTYL
jgi:hypothetical protein